MMCVSVCLSVYLSVYLFVCLSVILSVYVCVCFCLDVCLYIHARNERWNRQMEVDGRCHRQHRHFFPRPTCTRPRPSSCPPPCRRRPLHGQPFVSTVVRVSAGGLCLSVSESGGVFVAVACLLYSGTQDTAQGIPGGFRCRQQRRSGYRAPTGPPPRRYPVCPVSCVPRTCPARLTAAGAGLGGGMQEWMGMICSVTIRLSGVPSHFLVGLAGLAGLA